MIPLRIAARIALGVAALAGCGGESDAAGGAGGAAGECPPPNRLVGDACREPGVQDDGCPAGTLGLGDGTCRPAGIPPEMCGEGFVHDGDVGCEPILPAEECPPAQMAVPGDTACRPVMPCAPGKWGDIATDATTEHVDGAYAGGGSDGSAANPWTTIADAIAAVAPGATVAVAAGSYAEDVVIQGKPIGLWGVCPDEVEIVATGAVIAAINVGERASGSVVRGLSVTGAADGLLLSGSQELLVDRVRVHDTGGRGIDIENGLGPTSCTVRGSLLEGSSQAGVFSSATSTTIEATVVRATHFDVRGGGGRGINIEPNTADGTPAAATVRRSVVEQNREFGVYVSGSSATVEATVVRDTLPDADGTHGTGIGVQDDAATRTPSTVVLRSSLFERNRGRGVSVFGSEATIEATVVRGTLPDAQGHLGRGISIMEDSVNNAVSTVIVRSALVEQNREVGVFVVGSEVTIETTVVRGTLQDGQGFFGRGIVITLNPNSGARSTSIVRGSLVEHNNEVAVHVTGSDATIEANLVRHTALGAQGLVSRGVNVQNHPDSGVRSTATVRSSLVEQSQELGIAVVASDATIEGCLVRATLANVEGRFGDGVGALTNATLSVDATLVEDSARAGVSNFGAFVSLGDTVVQCAAFDLEGEPFNGSPFTFENRGGNVCGCPSAGGECLLETVGIAPPTPVTPIE